MKTNRNKKKNELKEIFKDFEQQGDLIEQTVDQNQVFNVSDNEASNNASMEDVWMQLDNMVGLEEVKRNVRTNFNYIKFMQARKSMNLGCPQRLYNIICTGAPGTGKTTVCRLLGRLFHECGLLSKGHVVEVSRAQLVGTYIGQTEEKTKEYIQQASGGILFLDEAYSLFVNDDGRDFGHRVIDVLLPYLSEGKDMIVVLAGYSEEMSTFMSANPGLQSRFPLKFNFPDYTPAELMEIAERYFQKYNYLLADEARDKIMANFQEAVKIKNFGNGRFVKTFLENTVIPRMSDRLAAAFDTSYTAQDLMLIVAEDIPEAMKNKLQTKRKIGFR